MSASISFKTISPGQYVYIGCYSDGKLYSSNWYDNTTDSRSDLALPVTQGSYLIVIYTISPGVTYYLSSIIYISDTTKLTTVPIVLSINTSIHNFDDILILPDDISSGTKPTLLMGVSGAPLSSSYVTAVNNSDDASQCSAGVIFGSQATTVNSTPDGDYLDNQNVCVANQLITYVDNFTFSNSPQNPISINPRKAKKYYQAYQESKKPSYTWLWITLGVLGIIILIAAISVGGYFIVKKRKEKIKY